MTCSQVFEDPISIQKRPWHGFLNILPLKSMTCLLLQSSHEVNASPWWGRVTVAGRVPSILQRILVKNGAKGSIRWLVALLWPSQVWLHHHSQSHGALSHPNPQPNAVGPQQEKTFRRLNSFFSTRLERSIATATRQPEKTCSASEKFFWPFPTQKVSK